MYATAFLKDVDGSREQAPTTGTESSLKTTGRPGPHDAPPSCRQAPCATRSAVAVMTSLQAPRPAPGDMLALPRPAGRSHSLRFPERAGWSFTPWGLRASRSRWADAVGTGSAAPWDLPPHASASASAQDQPHTWRGPVRDENAGPHESRGSNSRASSSAGPRYAWALPVPEPGSFHLPCSPAPGPPPQAPRPGGSRSSRTKAHPRLCSLPPPLTDPHGLAFHNETLRGLSDSEPIS